VTRGLIAADPRVLPIGTRVRVEAGPWTGEYLVADTGGAIKGRKIDIWTPSSREAMQFGRRAVKLTVLSLPGPAREICEGTIEDAYGNLGNNRECDGQREEVILSIVRKSTVNKRVSNQSGSNPAFLFFMRSS
jgi:hypothetical protein